MARAHQSRRDPSIFVLLQHMKRATIAKIAKEIKTKPSCPMGHILHLRPVVWFRAIWQNSNVVSNLASMNSNDAFGALWSTLGKCWGNGMWSDCVLVLVTHHMRAGGPTDISTVLHPSHFMAFAFGAMDSVNATWV